GGGDHGPADHAPDGRPQGSGELVPIHAGHCTRAPERTGRGVESPPYNGRENRGAEDHPMPGAAHMGPGKPMSERATAEVVWVYMVFPPLVALLFAAVTAYFTIANADSAPGSTPWLGLAWVAAVLLSVAVVPPTVGWREVRRRRRDAA